MDSKLFLYGTYLQVTILEILKKNNHLSANEIVANIDLTNMQDFEIKALTNRVFRLATKLADQNIIEKNTHWDKKSKKLITNFKFIIQ